MTTNTNILFQTLEQVLIFCPSVHLNSQVIQLSRSAFFDREIAYQNSPPHKKPIPIDPLD